MLNDLFYRHLGGGTCATGGGRAARGLAAARSLGSTAGATARLPHHPAVRLEGRARRTAAPAPGTQGVSTRLWRPI